MSHVNVRLQHKPLAPFSLNSLQAGYAWADTPGRMTVRSGILQVQHMPCSMSCSPALFRL